MNKVSHDSETPAKGQQVITAVAFIYRIVDDKIKMFLPKRAKTKKFLPDVYELPGGHIDYGEELEIGLAREIKEEFGVDAEIGEVFGAFTYLNDIKGSHSVELVYFAKFIDPIENIVINPEDHSSYKWIAEADLNEIYSAQKGEEDSEFGIVKKGFRILNEKGL